jgi:hypothetical protein
MTMLLLRKEKGRPVNCLVNALCADSLTKRHNASLRVIFEGRTWRVGVDAWMTAAKARLVCAEAFGISDDFDLVSSTGKLLEDDWVLGPRVPLRGAVHVVSRSSTPCRPAAAAHTTLGYFLRPPPGLPPPAHGLIMQGAN